RYALGAASYTRLRLHPPPALPAEQATGSGERPAQLREVGRIERLAAPSVPLVERDDPRRRSGRRGAPRPHELDEPARGEPGRDGEPRAFAGTTELHVRPLRRPERRARPPPPHPGERQAENSEADEDLEAALPHVPRAGAAPGAR